jgi:cellulose synthase/poly-beta-1,6-N-acetylglucosamine synthase-like glycosyltransferase
MFIQIVITAFLWRAWSAMPVVQAENHGAVRVAIVIAFRNEANHLKDLIDDLNKLIYSIELLEIILVDDHSEDQSLALLKGLKFTYPTQIITLKASETGKKAAIAMGIQHTQADLILTTDADCRLLPTWVAEIASFYHNTQANFIAAPVVIASNGTIWQGMQQIEFASLIGVSAILMEHHHPVMSNGANMAFNRLAYQSFDAGLASTVSGDDMFLMHHIHAHYPGTLRFLKSPQATVYTQAAESYVSFFQQRIRWAGKWTKYSNGTTKFTAIMVWLMNLSVLLVPFFLPLGIALSLLALKAVFEYLLLRNILALANIKLSFTSFVFLLVIYPWYVVIFGLIAGKMKYTWKGRMVQ